MLGQDPTWGLRCSSHGVYYQKLWILLFLERAVKREYSFYLDTEVESAAGFDDIIFCYKQNRKVTYRFIQIKHELNRCKKISIGELLAQKEKSNFGLIRYFIAYLKIKSNGEFEGAIEDFVIITNADFNSTDSILYPVRKLRVISSGKNKGKEIKVERIDTRDEFLDMGTKYKLIDSDGKIAEYLKQNIGPIKAKLNKKTKRNEKERKEISNKEIYEGINSFLDELVFVVNLPSNDELCEIVKDELGKGLNDSDKENLFGRCMAMVTNWMCEKNRRSLSSRLSGQNFDMKK